MRGSKEEGEEREKGRKTWRTGREIIGKEKKA
jgi:hypothetical protein